MKSVQMEFLAAKWKRMPKRLTPRWGRGTAVCEWCFSDEAPLVAEAVRANGGSLQLNGWTLRFGDPKKFLHRFRFGAS